MSWRRDSGNDRSFGTIYAKTRRDTIGRRTAGARRAGACERVLTMERVLRVHRHERGSGPVERPLRRPGIVKSLVLSEEPLVAL